MFCECLLSMLVDKGGVCYLVVSSRETSRLSFVQALARMYSL